MIEENLVLMKQLIKESLYMLWSVLLTAGAVTFFLGAVPMHLSWNRLGRGWYYIGYLSLSLFIVRMGFVELGVAMAVLSLAVGFNNEVLVRGYNYFTSIVCSVVSSSGLFFLGLWLWATYSSFHLVQEGRLYLEGVVSQLQWPKESLETLVSADIFSQVPSILMMLLSMALVVTLLLEKRVCSLLGEKIPIRKALNEFKVPDAMIWPFIILLLGAFLKGGGAFIQQISGNGFNIIVFIYFFQGLAIISKYFQAFKVSLIWRVLATTVFVVYLPFLLILIGVLDYWINFRERILKKTTQIKERRES